MPSWIKRLLFSNRHKSKDNDAKSNSSEEKEEDCKQEDTVMGPRFMKAMMGFNDSIEVIKERKLTTVTNMNYPMKIRSDSTATPDVSFQAISPEIQASPKSSRKKSATIGTSRNMQTIVKDLETNLGSAIKEIGELRSGLERLLTDKN